MGISLEEFCKEHGYSPEQAAGAAIATGITELKSITAIPAGFSPLVNGELNLRRVMALPAGFSPVVGGCLNLRRVTAIPAGFSPVVGGYLDLGSLESVPADFNPIVGGSLNLCDVTSIHAGFNPIVGGSLNLRSLTTIPEGFSPIVGGDLNLSNLVAIPEGFNPIVGGDLNLRSMTSIPAGFRPAVGGRIRLSRHKLPLYNIAPVPLSWQDGRYRLIDGIFCEVLHKKKELCKIRIVGNLAISYVVTDADGRNFSHGETVQQAIDGLMYKMRARRDTEQYDAWTLDTEISLPEAIASYRNITGACEQGTRHFVESLKEIPKILTIRKVIQLTNGRFGHNAYKAFFAGKG